MTTVFDVTLRAAELTKLVRRGTATGGSTTTLVDTNHPSRADDYYNGQPPGTIWFISGNNASKSAVITDWVNSTKTFTFATQAGACAAGDAYAALHGVFSREALIAALNAAMIDYGPVESSADITATADTFRYGITCNPEQIVRVETIAAGATKPGEFFFWRAGGAYLYLDKEVGVGDTIRYFYYASPAYVTLDADTVNARYGLARLAWLTAYHAALVRLEGDENQEPGIKLLFEEAKERRNEWMVRRPGRPQARGPHLATY
jgi:hypothetical protein